MHFYQLVTLALCAIAHFAFPAQTMAELPKISLVNFDREVLAVNETHVLWYSRELVEATRAYRASSFKLRYYLQPIGRTEADLIHEEVVVSRIPRGVILSDGSVLRQVNSELLWIDPKRGVKRRDDNYTVNGERARCVGLFPDGAILATDHTDVTGQLNLYWVPIKAGAFDEEKKWALASSREFVGSIRFGRHNNTIIWIGTTSEAEDKHRQHLAIADLDKKSVTKQELPDHINRGLTVEAFDGKTAYTGPCFIDVSTGNTTKTKYIMSLGMTGGRLFGAEGDKGELSLVSIDVGKPEAVSTHGLYQVKDLYSPAISGPDALRARNAFLVSGNRTLAWNGSAWILWQQE